MKAIFVEPGQPAIPADLSFEEIRASLGIVSFAYPFSDPVALAHDDDGIANGRLPNRTVNGQIIPGPFYVVQVTDDGKVISLSPELEEKYLQVFAIPESFGPGKWKVSVTHEEGGLFNVVRIVSEWIENQI